MWGLSDYLDEDDGNYSHASAYTGVCAARTNMAVAAAVVRQIQLDGGSPEVPCTRGRCACALRVSGCARRRISARQWTGNQRRRPRRNAQFMRWTPSLPPTMCRRRQPARLPSVRPSTVARLFVAGVRSAARNLVLVGGVA